MQKQAKAALKLFILADFLKYSKARPEL